MIRQHMHSKRRSAPPVVPSRRDRRAMQSVQRRLAEKDKPVLPARGDTMVTWPEGQLRADLGCYKQGGCPLRGHRRCPGPCSQYQGEAAHYDDLLQRIEAKLDADGVDYRQDDLQPQAAGNQHIDKGEKIPKNFDSAPLSAECVHGKLWPLEQWGKECGCAEPDPTPRYTQCPSCTNDNLVMLEVDDGAAPSVLHCRFCTWKEGDFLHEGIPGAPLDARALSPEAVKVVLAAEPDDPSQWVTVSMTDEQMVALDPKTLNPEQKAARKRAMDRLRRKSNKEATK